MATFTDTLSAITNRKQAPYRFIKRTLTGVDIWQIHSGDLFDIPNVFELVSLRCDLTTDATVANRYIDVYSYPHGMRLYSKTAITASSTNILYASRYMHNDDALPSGTSDIAGFGEDTFLLYQNGDYLNLRIVGGVAGDSAVWYMTFKYRNWDLGMKMSDVFELSKWW